MMADSISPTFQRTFSEEFLTCAICMEHYIEPRQLNCLHSFCTKCLESIIQKSGSSFYCPLCRTKYKSPQNGTSDLKIDFRIKNLFDYMQREKERQEEAENAVAEVEESAEEKPDNTEALEKISDAIKAAKLTNKRIRNHMKMTKSRQEHLDERYENLLHALGEREELICSTVKSICHNYRQIIEHDKGKMDLKFERELQSTKEWQWFLANCYHKFKDILTSEEVPSELVLLQLDATVAQISNENFQTPEWTVPYLDVTERSQEDKFVLHSLIGSLVMNRRKQCHTTEPSAPIRFFPENSDDDNVVEDDESDADSDIIVDPEHVFAEIEEDPEEENDQEEEEEEEEENEDGVRKGFFKGLRKKKRRHRVKLGFSMLKQAMKDVTRASVSALTPKAAATITEDNDDVQLHEE